MECPRHGALRAYPAFGSGAGREGPAAHSGCRPELRGVQGVHDIRTRNGGDRVFVELHVEVDGQLTVDVGHESAMPLKRR
ncbi:cation transporter dimerization domain-containing protein [Sodalis ligni]|uniref:cation transporter dimerization domain-containing protein n=1 Tax=Sodalis ligni TaxID=2697027 RepID=UPI0030B820CC